MALEGGVTADCEVVECTLPLLYKKKKELALPLPSAPSGKLPSPPQPRSHKAKEKLESGSPLRTETTKEKLTKKKVASSIQRKESRKGSRVWKDEKETPFLFLASDGGEKICCS